MPYKSLPIPILFLLPITINPPTRYNEMPPLNAELCPHSVRRYATSRETGDSIDIIQAGGLRSVDQPVIAGWALIGSRWPITMDNLSRNPRERLLAV